MSLGELSVAAALSPRQMTILAPVRQGRALRACVVPPSPISTLGPLAPLDLHLVLLPV